MKKWLARVINRGSINLKKNNMRNRDLLVNKCEYLEGHLKTLRGIVQRQEPVATYLTYLNKVEELMEEIKAMIEREDMTPGELNRIN